MLTVKPLRYIDTQPWLGQYVRYTPCNMLDIPPAKSFEVWLQWDMSIT